MQDAITAYNASLDFFGMGGHSIDKVRAFKLNAEAAALGFADAILSMGWYYLNGCGVERNLPLARYWYRRSARSGEAKAMFSLGQMSYYEFGYDEARRWFERATKHGDIHSYYWLGKLAWRGHGVPHDRSAAFALFHRAARGHDPEAVRVLRFLSRRSR